MADSVKIVCFKGLVLGFITSVVICICFFCVMRVEQHVDNNMLARLGAERCTPEGKPNPWYFFVRDAPVIRSLTAMPFLSVPKMEWTDKGFKFRGRDYEATFDRVSRVDSEEDAGNAGTKPASTEDKPQTDYGLTVVKGKTHVWKTRTGFKPISMLKVEVGAPDGAKKLTKDREQFPSVNAIPMDDGTVKE